MSINTETHGIWSLPSSFVHDNLKLFKAAMRDFNEQISDSYGFITLESQTPFNTTDDYFEVYFEAIGRNSFNSTCHQLLTPNWYSRDENYYPNWYQLLNIIHDEQITTNIDFYDYSIELKFIQHIKGHFIGEHYFADETRNLKFNLYNLTKNGYQLDPNTQLTQIKHGEDVASFIKTYNISDEDGQPIDLDFISTDNLEHIANDIQIDPYLDGYLSSDDDPSYFTLIKLIEKYRN